MSLEQEKGQTNRDHQIGVEFFIDYRRCAADEIVNVIVSDAPVLDLLDHGGQDKKAVLQLCIDHLPNILEPCDGCLLSAAMSGIIRPALDSQTDAQYY